MAAGPRRSATLLPFIPVAKKYSQESYGVSSRSQLLRKYLCAQEHSSFYALATLFPSISRYKRNHTRADKQDGNSNDEPIFSPTHFHSVKRSIPWVLSDLIMMALTRIYAPSLLLCWFILAHCLDPHHSDDITDIDQSVLAYSYTFNDQSSTPHSPSAML